MSGSVVQLYTIAESFPYQDGNLALTGGTWSRPDDLSAQGQFVDYLSTGVGNRQGTALQTFRASGEEIVNQQLYVLGLNSVTGILDNTYTPGQVTINGTTTNIRCGNHP